MRRFNTNNARLFLKGLITTWVPVLVVFDIVDWGAETVALVMAASTWTVDSLFRVFSIEEGVTTVTTVTEDKPEATMGTKR